MRSYKLLREDALICVIEDFHYETNLFGPFDVAEDGTWLYDIEFFLSHKGKDWLCAIIQASKPWEWPPMSKEPVCFWFERPDFEYYLKLRMKVRINGEIFECDLYGTTENHPQAQAFCKQFHAIISQHNYVDWDWYYDRWKR